MLTSGVQRRDAEVDTRRGSLLRRQRVEVPHPQAKAAPPQQLFWGPGIASRGASPADP